MRDRLTKINEECSALLQADNNSDDINSLTYPLLFLGGIELIAIIVLYIKEGFSNDLMLYLAALLIMFLLYKLRLSSASKLAATVDINNLEGSDMDNLLSKFSYLEAGLHVKQEKVKSIKWFYIIVVPVFMLTMHQLFKEAVGGNYNFFAVPILFVISFIIWSWFFSSDIDKLRLTNNRIIYLNNKARLIAKS